MNISGGGLSGLLGAGRWNGLCGVNIFGGGPSGLRGTELLYSVFFRVFNFFDPED